MNNNDIMSAIKDFSTPSYIFDIDELENRIDYLNKKLNSVSDLCYAMKANPFLVKIISNKVKRIEVCSPGEFDICIKSGVEQSKLVISGVYKKEFDIEMMLKNYPDIGIYTAESLLQYELICKYAKKYNRKVNLLLRLTSTNQFGMNEEDIKTIIEDANQFVNIIGIQYFTGTQKSSLKRIAREVEKISLLISHLKEELGFEIKEFEYGPGLPVRYFENEKPFDEAGFLDEFAQILQNMNFDGKITLELGRFVAASCGVYLAKAVDIKTNGNQNFCITDGGMNHISYYGQSMAMKIPQIQVLPERNDEQEECYNLCGALCTVNDIMVKQFPVKGLKNGDVFVFKNAGAYCMTEGISLFLTRPLPKILSFSKENGFSMMRDETPVDFLNISKF